MPIHRGKDIKGTFYQYGSQKKYYYKTKNTKSRNLAKKKAIKQAIAIHSTGYKE